MPSPQAPQAGGGLAPATTPQVTLPETPGAPAPPAAATPEAQTAQAPPTPKPLETPATKGPPAAERVEAILARGVSDDTEPVSPGVEFPEDAERIYVVLKSRHSEAISVRVSWVVVDAEGYPAGHVIESDDTDLDPGERDATYITPPGSAGFPVGDYRVDITVDGGPPQSVPFKVLPLHPPALPTDRSPPPPGFNLANRAFGGKVESRTSQYNDSEWAAANLIDGTTRGWSSSDRTTPQEVVLSFRQGREAQVAAVVVDTRTQETLSDPTKAPRHVEVWASTTGPAEGFSRVAGARLGPRPGEYLIALPPATRARYVKLRFLSNHGGSYTQAGEVKVIEAPDAPSILADVPKNLALAELGGTIVRFTSQDSEERAALRLIDGSVETAGWQSTDAYLPQEIVFAFRGERAALVDRIVLNPKTTAEPATWVKTFTVAVSTETPLDGFREVGQFTLRREARDQAFTIGQPARFVRLRILSNHGGTTTSLGEVKLIEGAEPGYRSILLEQAAGTAQALPGVTTSAEAGGDVEREPNNTPAQANSLMLGRRTRGTIDPLGEQDHFRITVPGSGLQVLTVDLAGRPYIRTSVALLDRTEREQMRFDPGVVPAAQTAFSWAVRPDDYTLRVTEPPVSIVLIWDTSGSMSDSIKHLQQAVEATLDQVRPTERLNLIRFSGDVEVLLPGFTSDRERLKAAAAGKFSAGGGTRFYDAVARGTELLAGVRANRAIVVMTDGADTSSTVKYAQFWRLVEKTRIRLYTIGLGAELLELKPDISTTPARMMNHLAMATNGRFFFAQSSEDLKGVYQQIVDELKTISTYTLRAGVSRGTGGLAVAATGERLAAVSAPGQIELILDASGSMKEKVEGRPKIDIAREVVVQIIKGLPDDVQVALRVYGHRIREGRPGDCKDSELVVPFGRIDKGYLIARVQAIRALGTTPIAYSLRQVAADFGKVPGEKMVILVTDGKEECKGDPAAAVSALLAAGLKVRLNIVGFALADPATKRDMERVARLTGGMFFDAANAAALTQAIQQSLAVPYDVLDAAGRRVGGGLTGQGPIELPEGIFTVVVRAAGEPITVPGVRVALNGFTKVVLKKEGREVGVQVLGP
ncbi:MAG: VWA domain-containing protein [Armatimonadota bacterium]|nr:VWA domain-containing protein [Armatimonadota bacterium]